jgi:hypothetical protein
LTYTISGQVTIGGSGLENVIMNGLPGNPTTDAEGNYNAAVDYSWSGTVTPTLAGYAFTDPATTYTNVTSNQATDYTATLLTYTISGTVTSDGSGLANVVMNGLPGNPVTDSEGNYAATVDYSWSGTVTPTLAGYTFAEPSTTYTNVTSNQTTNYTATLLTYTISGTVTYGGTGLANVLISGLSGDPVTDPSGFYTAAVDYGWSGTVTPSLAGYTFTEPSTTYTNVTSNQTTNYTAVVTTTITVLSPNGGENLDVGSTYNITWTSTGIVGDVKIEYSPDNGANWLDITASTTNDGSHPWTIPNTPSDQCLVRISEIEGTPSDVSDGVFLIPGIKVTTPNWGEDLEANSIININWHTMGVTGNVDIDYSLDNGTNWINIVSSTANDGTHPWQVPDSPSSTCLVRISETSGTLSDTSDITFSIVPETPLPPISLSCTGSGSGSPICGRFFCEWK